MIATNVLAVLVALQSADKTSPLGVRSLIDTIEAIQQPVEDFRCEYEGRIYYKDKTSEMVSKLGPDGLFDEFGGIFIWKRGGDTYSDAMHRQQPDGKIIRESLVVRARENQAEYYQRKNDAPLGYALIERPRNVNACRPACLGQIFLIDEIKRLAADTNFEGSVSEEMVDGHQLKVLAFALNGIKGVESSLIFRFWIDLQKGGHVVRQESYAPGKVVNGRLDIKLTSFKIGDVQVWMPTSGESVGYAAEKDGKPVTASEPTITQTIYVNGGTMEFNQKPGVAAFKINYKPGTPVSDKLSQLQYEFGQQRVTDRPTKRQAEESLRAQVEEAQRQGKELLASSPARDRDWSSVAVWLFGGFALVASIALWVQRRAH